MHGLFNFFKKIIFLSKCCALLPWGTTTFWDHSDIRVIKSSDARRSPVVAEQQELTTGTFLAGPNCRVKHVCLNHLCHNK